MTPDRPTPLTDAEVFAASLPLDWDHSPANAFEGWEMMCRAKARYRQLERQNAELREALEAAVAIWPENLGVADAFLALARAALARKQP